MTKQLLTIEMSGASQDEVVIEPSDLKLFKALSAQNDGVVKVKLDTEAAVTAFNTALKWARRESSLQKMLQSREEFQDVAEVAHTYDIEMLKDELIVLLLTLLRRLHWKD